MSSLESALRIFPRTTFGGRRSWRLVERNLASSRDAWLVVVSGFFEPLFYLLALGIGVGALVGSVALEFGECPRHRCRHRRRQWGWSRWRVGRQD